MNEETRKEQARDRIEEYLSSITEKKGKMYNCPFCGSGTGGNRTPAGSVKNKRFSCFSCSRTSMDIFDLVKEYEHIATNQEAFTRVYELLGIAKGEMYMSEAKATPESSQGQEMEVYGRYEAIKRERQRYIEKCFNNHSMSSYFPDRGMTQGLIEKYKLGYDPDRKAHVIPLNGHQYSLRSSEGNIKYMNSSIDKNEPHRDKLNELDHIGLFNEKYLHEPGEEIIYITEGIIDALSIELTGEKAIALAGTVPQRLFNALPKECLKTFVIATDPDRAGVSLKENIIKGLTERNLKYIEFPEYAVLKPGADPDHADAYEVKDINDLLLTDPLKLANCVDIVRNIHQEEKEAEKREYQENRAGNQIEAFKKGIIDRSNTPAIRTTFPNLDHFLDGGFYEGLYILGAISSLGKTSFILQIADQIAKQGKDVIIISLEMARSELMAKSISRLSFLEAPNKTMAKTTRGILAGHLYKKYCTEEVDLIEKAIEVYQNDYADHLYLYEGIGDIGVQDVRNLVEKHKRLTGNDPVIVIDYLQILKPYSDKYTDKMNTDKAVTELKRITRDYKIPIIAISSFNRENYKLEVNMSSFKESGAIEYSSDVLIGLQLAGAGTKGFDADEAKSRNPREVELKILKNRNGKTGVTLGYEYYPMFNYFTETTEDFNRPIP